MKKLFVMLLLAALMVAGLSSCLLTADTDKAANAASVVTLDVNPSVRIYLSSEDTVLEVEAVTEDGEAVAAEVEAAVTGETLDAAVEVIVDELFEEGYLGDESNSVLVSVEKKSKDLTDKINEKIKKTFEKHGKEACIITQELDELEEEMKENIDGLAEKYDISKGKARMIEKLREEFPELDEKELSELKMNDLALIFNGASDDVKENFKKHGETLEDMYVGMEAALKAALEDASLTEDAITFKRVHISREDGKMVYEVEFVYENLEYEFTVDATTGEILEKETEEFEMPDVDAELGKFYEKNGEMIDKVLNEAGLDKEGIKDMILGGMLDGSSPSDKPETKPEEKPEDYHIGRAEAIEAILSALGIEKDNIADSKVRVIAGENGAIISVTLKTKDDNVYRATVDAYTGIVMSAEMNGVAVDLTVSAEESTEDAADKATEETVSE